MELWIYTRVAGHLGPDFSSWQYIFAIWQRLSHEYVASCAGLPALCNAVAVCWPCNEWAACLCRVEVPSTLIHCYSNTGARQKSGNKYYLNTMESNSWQHGTILVVFQSRLVDHALFAIWIMRRCVVTEPAFVTGSGKFVRVLNFLVQGSFVLLENVDLR